MEFYFVQETPDYVVTTDEGWVCMDFRNAGDALRYLLRVKEWAEKKLKAEENVVWTIEMDGPVLSIWFSNPYSATLFSLSGLNNIYPPY